MLYGLILYVVLLSVFWCFCLTLRDRFGLTEFEFVTLDLPYERQRFMPEEPGTASYCELDFERHFVATF